MNLLGTGAVVTTVACLLLGVVGGTALQHLIRRRGGVAVLLRLLVTLLSCSLVVVGIALELNRENGWYATTSELTGGTDTAGESPVQVAPGLTSPKGPLPALPAPGQRLQRYLVSSSQGSMSNRVYVLLPSDYFDAASARKTYPVLVLAHGMPGSVQQWLASMDIRRTMDPLVSARRFASTIVVIPTVQTPSGKDTECVFGPDGPNQMENWLANDIPSFVLSHFRARAEAQSWAAMGFSAGAWCSSMLAMLHPNRFGAAISLGGYFRPQWADEPPFGSTTAQGKRLDLVRLARSGHAPAVAIWAQSSAKDSESGPSTRAFAAAARPPLQFTLVMDATGGHRTDIWNDHVPGALAWLASVRPAFR